MVQCGKITATVRVYTTKANLRCTFVIYGITYNILIITIFDSGTGSSNTY